MNGLLLNVFLALVWMLLVGDVSLAQLILGLILGYLVLRTFPEALNSAVYIRHFHAGAAFMGEFLRDLTVANVQVALFALQRRPPLKPMIIEVPLRSETDSQRTLLVALLTLMPGTVAMGFSPDKRRMYAHTIGMSDIDKAHESIIKTERDLLNVLAPELLENPPTPLAPKGDI